MVSGYDAKNYENWPTFDKVTVKIKVAQFFLTYSVVETRYITSYGYYKGVEHQT